MKKTMKAMAILLCAVAMVMMSACSKESTNERRIIGKWITTSGIKYCYDVRGNLKSTKNLSVGDVYEFFRDGRATEDGFFWKYSLNGDELVIGEGNLTFSIRIVELTNTTMIWERQSEVYDGMGIVEDYYYVWHTVLERQ